MFINAKAYKSVEIRPQSLRLFIHEKVKYVKIKKIQTTIMKSMVWHCQDNAARIGHNLSL